MTRPRHGKSRPEGRLADHLRRHHNDEPHGTRRPSENSDTEELLEWLEGDVVRLRSFATVLLGALDDPAYLVEGWIRPLAVDGLMVMALRLEAMLELVDEITRTAEVAA